MEPTVIINNKQHRIVMIMLIIIFFLLEKSGLVQTNGKINGPTSKKPTTSEEGLKYHFFCFLSSIFALSLIRGY